MSYSGLASSQFFPGIGLIHATGYFRGAPFRLDSYETSGGRRNQVFEYPMRNTPHSQDLGRRARKFNFTGYVLGPLWEIQRDALINACEEDGPGLLVHPFHGEHMVVCDNWTVSEGRSSGGAYASFQLEFREGGEMNTPSYEQDPGHTVLSDVSGGRPVIEGAF